MLQEKVAKIVSYRNVVEVIVIDASNGEHLIK